MGIKFGEEHGSAKKNEQDYIKLEFGDNTFRLVGEILPRYCYWKNLKGNDIPIECLSFDREKEKFTNIETDWFKHYFPEAKCSWSYVIQAIDPKDGKLKLLGLKKKLYEQIRDVSKELGDPTDPVKGWDVIVEKKKTGPNKFNVEYILKQLKLKPRALTEEELELVKNMKSIDSIITRPTAEEQKDFIERSWINVQEENSEDDAAAEAAEEFNKDTPF